MYETYRFDERPKRLVYRPHNFSRKIKHTSVVYCSRCGLVPLSNDATRKTISKGCLFNLDTKE